MESKVFDRILVDIAKLLNYASTIDTGLILKCRQVYDANMTFIYFTVQ